MNADGFEGFARSALALILLASYKIGGDGGVQRSRQRARRAAHQPVESRREASDHGSAPHPEPRPADNPKSGHARRRAWLRDVATAFWIALLLLTLIYATVRGESGFADLDEIRLLADF